MKTLSQLSMMLSRNIRELLAGRCVVCERLANTPVCRICLMSISIADYRCGVCAEKVPKHVGKCKNCIEKPPAFDKVSIIGSYQDSLAELIIAAKIAKQVHAIAALQYIVQTMGNDFTAPQKNTALLPMPSPKSCWLTRGFNLPTLLAKQWAKQYQLSVLPPTAVSLPFFVPKQAKLSRQQRQKNHHYYQINTQLPENIVIIDDIITTGSTVNELAKSIREKGVKTVDVWAIAKVFDV